MRASGVCAESADRRDRDEKASARGARSHAARGALGGRPRPQPGAGAAARRGQAVGPPGPRAGADRRRAPAQFRQRRVRLLDRNYPRAAQDYDETVYRALGLVTGGKGVLRQDADRDWRTGPASTTRSRRTAYVQSGAGERAAALHELVHALQDQHFDLRRTTRLPGGSDARIAAAAAIEGHAALVAARPALAHDLTRRREADTLRRARAWLHRLGRTAVRCGPAQPGRRRRRCSARSGGSPPRASRSSTSTRTSSASGRCRSCCR